MCVGKQPMRLTRSSHPRLYFVWYNMVRRCTKPETPGYEWYGGKGVSVCDEWKNDFDAFARWAVKSGYDEDAKRNECTLDRIDSNGNYEPNNCRWVDMKVQNNNRVSNRILTFRGVSKTVTEWGETLGVNPHLIFGRLRMGWSVEKILTTPSKRKGV